jgi:ribonuclease HI
VPASPEQLLLALAEHESLDAASASLGIPKHEARQLLRSAAKQLGGSDAEAPSAAVASPGEARRVRVFTDGAARGNPGLAGAGAVLLDEAGNVLARVGRFLGKQTNNVAEYQALLLGLRRARQLGAREVEVRADSQLLVRQLLGKYAVKNDVLRRLHEEALALLRSFDKFELIHIPREQNALADEMSNRAIDEQMNDT